MAISWEAHWSLITWRGSWGQGGVGQGGSPSWEIDFRPQREGSVGPRIGVLVGSGWAEGATRLKLGGGSSWDSTVRGLHTPRVDSTGVGALFGQKGGDLDRIYALLRFTLSSEENFVIAGHSDRIENQSSDGMLSFMLQWMNEWMNEILLESNLWNFSTILIKKWKSKVEDISNPWVWPPSLI